MTDSKDRMVLYIGKSRPTWAPLLWSSLAILLLGAPPLYGQSDIHKPEGAAARSAVAWYKGQQFIWRNFSTTNPDRPVYPDLFSHLPKSQRESAERLAGSALFPLDVSAGPTSPKISFIYAVSGSLTQYSTFPGLVYLDLHPCRQGLNDLTVLIGSQISALSLPDRAVTDRSIASLILAKDSLPNLRHIDIYARNDAVTPQVLDALKKRRKLCSLQLSGHDVSDVWLSRIGELDQLRGLRLYGTSVTVKGLRSLQQLPWLTHLSIANWDRITEQEAAEIADCTALRELHLSGRNITDETIKSVSKAVNVERMVLDNVDITSVSAEELVRMRALRILVFRTEDPKILAVLNKWKQDDPKLRELYTTPDLYFGGWVSELEVFWMSPRELDPSNYP